MDETLSHTGLAEIAIVAVTALVLGLILQRLRQPAVVGFIVAGIFLGSSGLGLIEDRESIGLLAELGVLLLLFVIGMELSLRAFRRVYRVALIGAGAQIALSVGATLLMSRVFDWPLALAVLLGFAVALSSTAVAIKMLDEIGELRTEVGRTAVGVLIAQDLAVVPMLLVIESLAGDAAGFDLLGLVKVVVGVGLLLWMIRYLTRRERVMLPFAGLLSENVEMMALTAMAVCFGAAVLSSAVGLSPAYGAFLAGLWIGNSNARVHVLGAAMPIQGVLLMVFFLSIGLLIDLGYIWANIGSVLTLLIAVTVLKTAMNIALLRLLGEPWPRAWLAGTVLGQIGEFSFVLLAAGVAVGLIDFDAERLVVSVIALSLIISPLWLLTARRLQRLAWSGVSTIRQIVAQLYGRETRAVARASSRAVALSYRITLQLGEEGARRVRQNEQADETAPPPDPDDADFDVEADNDDEPDARHGER